MVATGLQALKFPIALQALDIMRSKVALVLQASKSPIALQALEVMRSKVAMLLKNLNWTVKQVVVGLDINLLSKK